MRSASKTGIFKACLLSMEENNTFIILQEAVVATEAATGASISQQLVREILKSLG